LDEVVAEFFAFFGAGTDTTTNSLNLALHYLSSYPEYVEKLYDEYQVAKSMKLSPGDEIKQLKFGDAIFNECLRINGPASMLFSRVCVENVNIGNLDLPKSTTVSVSPLLVSYKENTFP
jgi:cytochrome P450